jgi:2-polyprenyl-3-methyl-5-hydroxy-6-metoxy-1,4-benzoquinol methylase
MNYQSFRDPLDQKTPLLFNGNEFESTINGAIYPILNDIPRFIPEFTKNYAGNFGKQWNQYRKLQLDSYTKKPLTENRLKECFPVPLEELKGKRILEVGSGAGRFTEILISYGAIIDSFDFSEAVEANLKNNFSESLSLCQASVYNIPFEKSSYDFVICLGVLQHTPSPETSIEKLWEMTKPGGYIVIDHYRFKWKSLPPPIGGFGNVFRLVVLMLPEKSQMKICDLTVRFFFPIHWLFRNSKLLQHVLFRISPVRFYYPWLGLETKNDYFWWAMLDTHDGSTDKYHHKRSVKQISVKIASLDPESYWAVKGGNGVIAWAKK